MLNNFGLFFTRDGTIIRLPVNPEKLPVAKDNDNGEYNVLGIGPIMVPRIPDLQEISISSFFPGRVFSGVLTSGDFEPPEFYIQFFQSAMDDKVPILYTPVRYYEDGTPFFTGDTGLDVLVTSFSYEERGGETGDFYYDLTLTEYRDYSPQIVQLATNMNGTASMAEPNRKTPSGEIVVGSVCIANGPWYYTSYGEEPHGNGNGRRVIVSRIVDSSRAYPIHVTTESGGWLGWMKKSSLQVVSE